MSGKSWIKEPEQSFHIWAKSHGYSDKTIKSYFSMFNTFIGFINLNGFELKSVDSSNVSTFLNKKNISEKTEKAYLWLLTDIFNDMIENNEINVNPAESILSQRRKMLRGKKPRRLPIALSSQEQDKLIRYLNELGDNYSVQRVRCTILLMMGCGLRAQETCDVCDKDIHLNEVEPYLTVIGKGNRERAVPVPDNLVEILKAFRKIRNDQTKEFLSAKGQNHGYTPVGLYVMVKKAMQKSGIIKSRMSPHVLRHTFATNQLLYGINLSTLKLWMGHDFISTTAIYDSVTSARGNERPIMTISHN